MHKNWEKGVTLYPGHIVTQVIEKPTSPGYEIARGVSFQEFLVKVSMAKGKNKMEPKKTTWKIGKLLQNAINW